MKLQPSADWLIEFGLDLGSPDLAWAVQRGYLQISEAVKFCTKIAHLQHAADVVMQQLVLVSQDDALGAEEVLLKAPDGNGQSSMKWSCIEIAALAGVVDLDTEAGWLAAEEVCADFDYPRWLVDAFDYQPVGIFRRRGKVVKLSESIRIALERELLALRQY